MNIYELEKSGQIFEGWRVVGFIGEGGFGSVYEIEREGFGVSTRSALKVISIPRNKNDVDELMSEGMDKESATKYFRGYVEEFVRECDLMSRLKGNSHIVSFEDYKVIEHTDDIGWDILIRMEKLTPLIEFMKDHPMTRSDVIDLGISMCDALSLCNQQNIIHRDIKPANIFVSQYGDYKLGDFGIARIVEKSNGASTKTGTSDYMAPEVFRGENYDSSVDIYSLGLVLYRLLNNNRLPFLPPAPEPITHGQREEAVTLRMTGHILPKPVNADNQLFDIICKASAHNPADRYKSPVEMKNALLRVKEGIDSDGKTSVVQDIADESDIKTDNTFDDEKTNRIAQDRRTGPEEFRNNMQAQNLQSNNNSNQMNYRGYQQTVPKKKHKAAKVVAIVFGAIFLFLVLIVAVGSGGSRKKQRSTYQTSSTSTSKSSTTEVAGSSTDQPSTASKAGDLSLQTDVVLVGDTVNTRYMAGGENIFYADDLVYTSSDESVAVVRRSKDGQRYVVEGVGVGTAEITGTYGEYTDSAVIRVMDYSEVMSELGLQEELYQNLVDNGLVVIPGNTVELSMYGEEKISIDLFEYFDQQGLILEDMAKSIYYYSSENIRLSVATTTEADVWDVTIKDLGGYSTSGYLTILITDVEDDDVLCTIKIPVEVEG